MAKYVVFFRYTGATVSWLLKNPGDRGAKVRELCESAGTTMESYYLMLGSWDGMFVIESPDSLTAAAISLHLSGSQAFAAVETHELFESSQLQQMLGTASGLTYSAPRD